MNFLERLEAEAHHEEDTKAQANWLSKVSSQVGNVMLLGSPPLGVHALGHPSNATGEWQQMHEVWQIRACLWKLAHFWHLSLFSCLESAFEQKSS